MLPRPLPRTLLRPLPRTLPRTLPASLAEPVAVSSAGRAMAFSLLGAAGQGNRRVDGSHARYGQALPGVDVLYTVQGNGLKEDLVLADASAPSSFRFALSSSSG